MRWLVRVMQWVRAPMLHRLSARAEAERRAELLLEQHLSPFQRAQYRRKHSIIVIGGDTGTRYLIRSGAVANIDELDARGKHICSWCFHPVGALPSGDVMLAQKIALESFELEAIKVANRMSPARNTDAVVFSL